jgi:hypothetical protein
MFVVTKITKIMLLNVKNKGFVNTAISDHGTQRRRTYA